MKKSALIATLKREAALKGVPFTARQFRDWVDEEFFQAAARAENTPNEWEYPEATLNACLEIIGLKAQGISRASLIRICLRVCGYVIPGNRIIEDINLEFRRILKSTLRTSPPTFDVQNRSGIGGRDELHIERRIATLDVSFEDAGVLHSIQSMTPLLSASYWGAPEGHSEKLWYLQMISGAFGEADQISNAVESELKQIEVHDINTAIDLYLTVLRIFQTLPTVYKMAGCRVSPELEYLCEKIARSLCTAEFVVPGIAILSVLTKRYKNEEASRTE